MEWLKVALIKVRAWLLALAANLWEDYLKDTLKEQLDLAINRGIELAQDFHKSEEYEKKKAGVIDYVFKNVQLPLVLKPFRGLIKAILSNSIEKKIEQGLEKLNTFKRTV